MKRIVLVGAGNVATCMGVALQRAGYEIMQVYSRTEASASVLADRLSTVYTVSVDEICRDADLYLVAVKDSALTGMVTELVKGREHALFVHTAGSMPIDVWKGMVSRYGVFYPLQTFSKQREVDFSRVPFFIEASSSEELHLLRELAVRLSHDVYELTSEQRKYLHVAAVFACNFTNHLYALGARLLEAHGIPFKVMLPLIDETARKVHELTPTKAQTGPAIRNDESVISMHLSLLADNPSMQDLYERISRSIRDGKTDESGSIKTT